MAKVLLVEDDNNLREIYQARLMAEGYDIVAAQNGEEALVIAKQNKPDLIISDVMMPRISGFEMLDILRNTEELKTTKVIMLTALGQADDQKRADGLGADRYLVKSQVTLEDIVNAAKDLLAEDGITAVPPAVPSDPLAMPAAAPAAAPAVAATDPIAPQPTPVVASAQPVEGAVPVVAAPAVGEGAVAPNVPAIDPTVPVAPVTSPSEPTAPAVAADSTALPQPPAAPASLDSPEPMLATPIVSPEPASTPIPVAVEPATEVEPAVGQTAASDATTAVSDEAQSMAAEEAALQAQIASYSQAPAEPAVAVDPSEAAESNEEALIDAVKELNSPTETQPLQPPSVINAADAPPEDPALSAPQLDTTPDLSTAPIDPTPVIEVSPTTQVAAEPTAEPDTSTVGLAAATEQTEPTQQVSIAGKKVIKPINDLSQQKPNLDALLAKEEASAAAAAPAIPVIGGTAPTSSTAATDAPVPPATPGQSFDPNSVAL